jgi:general secretion pathway protein C
MSSTASIPLPLPRLAVWLPLLALAALAGHTAWPLVQSGPHFPAAMEAHDRPEAFPVPPPPGSPLEALAEVPLFGALAAAPPAPPVPAPETRLRLRLVGLIAGAEQGDSRAIIAGETGPEALYRVGETLGGGEARLSRVLPDRVILQRGDGFETLYLPRETGEFLVELTEPWLEPGESETIATSGAAPLERSARPLDGERLLRMTQRVNRDGRLHGLAVRDDLTTYRFTRRTELRPGDVILSVNGVPASTLRARALDHKELLAGGRMELVIERRGELRQLSIDLGGPGAS